MFGVNIAERIMARVTVEDCVGKVHDRFELVAIAGQRAKNIASGAEPTIDRKGEKDTVVALREIAADNVDIDRLREEIIGNNQRKSVFANIEEEEIEVDDEADLPENMFSGEMEGMSFDEEDDEEEDIDLSADIQDDMGDSDIVFEDEEEAHD